MAERRKEPREAKRITLTFTVVGQTRVMRAIATNVSRSGLFIASGTLFPKGTRLLVTPVDDPQQKPVEFEVRNVRRFEDSPGMGLRRVVNGQATDATGSINLEALAPVPDPAPAASPAPAAAPGPHAVLPGESPALPEATAGGVKVTPRPAPAPEPAALPTVFTLAFDSVDKYRDARGRDIKRGGCFIAASLLPPQDAIVKIEIVPPMAGAKRVLVEARVVFRMEAAPGRNGGFGVEFVDRERVLAMLPDA